MGVCNNFNDADCPLGTFCSGLTNDLDQTLCLRPCQGCILPRCPGAANGTVCGTSTHGGTTLRCCNGVCPDPNCLPFGQPIPGVSDCTACLAKANQCCTQFPGCTTESGGQVACTCDAKLPGVCASDADCPFTPEGLTACICGACQVPPR
jgi:hypothetical protein